MASKQYLESLDNTTSLPSVVRVIETRRVIEVGINSS